MRNTHWWCLYLCLAVGGPALAVDSSVTLADIRYASGIDNQLSLSARIAYPPSGSKLPVLVVMHGLREQASSIHDDALKRMATAYGNGAFVIAVELRGRGKSDGSPDVGGREIQDIVDAIHFVLDHYRSLTDPNQIHIAGYSGGGGNAMSCAARYPDTFNTVTSFFGISDYGFDARYGWYQMASPGQQAFLRRWIGGTPAEKPDAYRSRASVSAIGNYSGGFLFLFHDRQDGNVPSVQSERVAELMAASGLHNFRLSITDNNDNPRWTHSAPNGNAGVIEAEKIFLPEIVGKRIKPWVIPAAGTLKVAGYVETKRFGVWLGDGTAGFATVTYDAPKATFSIVPESGQASWVLTLRERSPNVRTAIIVNGQRYSALADCHGTVSAQGTVNKGR